MSRTTSEPATVARPPCVGCGSVMDGEHHKRTSCSACKPPQSRTRKRGKASVNVTPPTEIKKPRPTVGAVKVKATNFPPADPAGEQHEYFIGCLGACPFQNVTVGGITFPLHTGRGDLDDKAQVIDKTGFLKRGHLVHLTERQVDTICESVTRKAIRFWGEKQERYVPDLSGHGEKSLKIMRQRGRMISTDANYRADPHDVPLAAFIYMIRTDGMDFRGREREPESMLQE